MEKASAESTLEKSLLNDLSTTIPNEIIARRLTTTELSMVIENLASTKKLPVSTTTRAVGALLRKGASNARAKDTMSVDVNCLDQQNSTTITRYDLAMALYGVVGHKTIRKLAEAMAPLLLEASINILRNDETVDHRGDLANKLDKALFRKGDPENYPPLTREESICACTYAQWLPNLNTIAGSTRLKGLLEQDLNGRSDQKRTKNKQPSKSNNNNINKEPAIKKANSALKAAQAAQAVAKKGEKKKKQAK